MTFSIRFSLMNSQFPAFDWIQSVLRSLIRLVDSSKCYTYIYFLSLKFLKLINSTFFWLPTSTNDLIVWKHLHRNGCLILIPGMNFNTTTTRNYRRQRCIFNCYIIGNASRGITWNWVNHDGRVFSMQTKMFLQ